MGRKSDAVFFVTTPRHLEPMLAKELEGLGFIPDQIRLTGGGVEVTATVAQAYRICLWSRLANSVLLKLRSFEASTPEQLYDGTRGVRWWEIMGVDQSFVVSCSMQRAYIDHSHYATLRVKDAIVDQFRERSGDRPDIDREDPDLYVHLHLSRDQATLYLDLAGPSLHRRSYRVESVAAPVKENTAAAALLKAGWPEIAAQEGALLDPMCGSGTFLIEGAMMVADVAPGLGRARFGFERWVEHEPEVWNMMLDEALHRRLEGLERLAEMTIVASDHDAKAIRATRANVNAAGFEDILVVRRRLDDIKRPEDFGLVIINPPYGERLGERQEAEALHVRFGELMVERFIGWKASVLTVDDDLGRKICLRARKRHKLFNGPMECSLLHFDIEEDRVYRPVGER